MNTGQRLTEFHRRRPALTSALFCLGMSLLGTTLIWLTKGWGTLATALTVQLTMTAVATFVAQTINGFNVGDTLRSVGAAGAITLCGILLGVYILSGG